VGGYTRTHGASAEDGDALNDSPNRRAGIHNVSVTPYGSTFSKISEPGD
jgi:hypothetical protein